MGLFRLDCEVVNIGNANRTASVSDVLVDTGSELTWIPDAILQQAGVQVIKKDLPFVMANGTTITRSTGYAILRASGFETIDEVVFGQPGDLALLGARTLDGFSAVVDPRERRLAADGPHPAAAAGTT